MESNSVFCLKMHKEMSFNLKRILEQWKKKLSPGSHIVLSKYFDFCLCLDEAELAGIIFHFYIIFRLFIIFKVSAFMKNLPFR